MKVTLEDPKRGNPLLLIVLIIVSLALVTVYFREGDSGPIHKLRSGMLEVAAPFERAGNAIVSPFTAVGSWFSDLSISREDLESLEAQNDELLARLAELEEARQENERLRELVAFAEERKLTTLGARIIGRPTSSWEGVITIDRGSADGVEPGMPVLAAQGLVGQVLEVSKNSAKVVLITDQRSGVAALIQSTRIPGVVEGSIEGDLTLEFVSSEEKPVEGDVILTSGLGGVYPQGLVIGDVTFVEERRGELFPRITVTSRVPIAQVEEVLVLVGAVLDTDVDEGSVE
ncbi:MAG: rod shape-determining protein MreC [Coriobacteriia bacterium]|nr:rod shape-determining protein MreC [Coriobacteriia bacterium]MBN2823492.1 rod shape-determining protein MreC [Coriobacteriia bacterium]